MHWLTEPGIERGKRNVGPDRVRASMAVKSWEVVWRFGVTLGLFRP